MISSVVKLILIIGACIVLWTGDIAINISTADESVVTFSTKDHVIDPLRNLLVK